jgi:hypothetical protein
MVVLPQVRLAWYGSLIPMHRSDYIPCALLHAIPTLVIMMFGYNIDLPVLFLTLKSNHYFRLCFFFFSGLNLSVNSDSNLSSALDTSLLILYLFASIAD